MSERRTTPAPEQPEGAPKLENVVFVLSHTTEPANIGASCRAMKTMGLQRLRLINPLNPQGRSARSLAHGTTDVLEAAELVSDVETAVADAHVVAGTTARRRTMRKHALLSPRQLAERLIPLTAEGTVVVMFGTERTGLTNDEVDICRYISAVDTSPAQPSLNLSQAVMLYGWEIRQAFLRATAPGREVPAVDESAAQRFVSTDPDSRRPEMSVQHPHRSTRLPNQFELDMTYAHLAHAMEAIGYSEFERRKFLTYLRQLHMRAGIVDWELQIYHLLARRILKITGRDKFEGDG
ncbi:MAG: TrmH family RNA methyltransferase [bacterium]